jgi:hypothetical protein
VEEPMTTTFFWAGAIKGQRKILPVRKNVFLMVFQKVNPDGIQRRADHPDFEIIAGETGG